MATTHISYNLDEQGDISVAELKKQLQAAQQALVERERDLELAAEVGQSLLESNLQLKSELDNALATRARTGSGQPVNADRIEGLEDALIDLQARHEAAQDELVRADERGRQASAVTRKLERAHGELQQTLQEVSERLNAAEAEKRRLAMGRADAMAQVHAIEQKYGAGRRGSAGGCDDEDAELAEALDRASRAESQLAAAVAARTDADAMREQREAEAERERARAVELEGLLETYRGYREEAEAERERAEYFERENEALRDEGASLKARLAVFEPSGSVCGADEGGKTLLSEVEDRRAALAAEHRQLSDAHTTLVRVHRDARLRQERMRVQVAKYAQLAAAAQSQRRERTLERALRQADSERTQLERAVVLLEDKLLEASRAELSGIVAAAMSFSSNGGGGGPNSNSNSNPSDLRELIAALSLRVEQAEGEAIELRRELRTTQLLKAAESDKAAHLRDELSDSCAEVQRLRNSCASLGYALDLARIDAKRRAQDPSSSLEPAASTIESRPDSNLQIVTEDHQQDHHQEEEQQDHHQEEQQERHKADQIQTETGAHHERAHSPSASAIDTHDDLEPKDAHSDTETTNNKDADGPRRSVVDRRRVANECKQQ